ncbi:MAG: acyl-CoA dehydrogenase family protein [Acidobacteria bacterium]|nr:acyl-CoA dehydrogenase family protein [Acidobacteriota bacterium]
MDLDLTEEQKSWRNLARDFAQNEVAPLVREMDEKGYMPPELIQRMGQLGFTGGPLPKEYGGAGMDYVSMALVYEEIGRVCSSVRGFLAVHVGLHALCIRDWGTEEQKRKWLPPLARAERRGCYALTEANAGSDVANMESTCRKEGEFYFLNGRKQWISNAMEADVALVFATSDRSLRHKGINAFVVETNAKGFRRERMTEKQLGHNASDHARIFMDEVRVHESQRLGPEGAGFKVAMGALDHGRLGVAAGAVGVGQACLDASISFANSRVQFGQLIGQFQMIQQIIAEMATEIEAARLLVYRAAAQKDQGKRNTTETSMAKFFATEAAARAANEAVLLHGSYGYSNEFPVERYLRDIKGYQIYEGTNHIQRIVIARAMLKGEGPKW